jgi:glycosyltransferase involved in cell wall biosynthesis
MDLISVIVPVYNSEVFLEKCLSSLINQRYKNLEIIVINDGSSDRSLEIIEGFANRDERVMLVSQENRGQSHARNVGIRKATGDYLIFVDSDDWLDSTFIEKLHSKIVEENVDIVVCAHKVHNINKVREIKINSTINSCLSSEMAFKYLLENKISHVCWAKMYRSHIVKDCGYFFPEGKTNEDLLIVSIWIHSSSSVYILNECLYNHNDRDGSITNSFTEKFTDLLDILDMLYEYLVDKEAYNSFEREFRSKYQNLVLYLVNYGVRYNNKKFINNVLKKSKIRIADFNLRYFPKQKQIMLVVLKFNVSLYYICMKLYYSIKQNTHKKG